MRRLLGWSVLVVACGLWSATVTATAGEPAKAKERTAGREITGEVVATTKRTLSLETSRTGGHIEEMLIPVNPSTVKFERILSLADLQRGDRVRVQYQLTYREDEQGQERLVGTSATKIVWLSRAVAATRGLRSESTDGTP